MIGQLGSFCIRVQKTLVKNIWLSLFVFMHMQKRNDSTRENPYGRDPAQEPQQTLGQFCWR
jgi:hypothetical protein